MLKGSVPGHTIIFEECFVYQQVLTEQQKEGRATNATAELFQRRLLVPKIYFQARWPNSSRIVDLLAIDRAGSGDIHVVEVKVGIENADYTVGQLLAAPAHYKYVALYDTGSYQLTGESLYSPDGF